MNKWWRKITGRPKKLNLKEMKKLFDSCTPVPELICRKKPTPKCNDGYYVVRLPRDMLLKYLNKNICGRFVELYFIGLKYD